MVKNEIQVLKSSELLGQQFNVYGTSENPYFIATQVAEMLSLTNVSDMISRVDVDERSKFNLGRQGYTWFLTEDGLYEVLMQSRKPIAKQFKKGVKEILKSIRRTGGYMTVLPDETPEQLLSRALLIANDALNRTKQHADVLERKTVLLQSQNEVQAERLEANDRTIKFLQPGATFAKAVQTSDTSILVGNLARIIKQNGVEIGQNRLFEWLRKKSYLISRKGESYNLPTQSSLNLGLFEIKKTIITRPDGTSLITTTPKVTGKGQVYFVNKFLYESINETELARQKAEREAKKGGAQ